MSSFAPTWRPCDRWRSFTYALVFPVDVLQVEAVVALADVASEGVDAFPEPGTHGDAGCTLIHICMHGRKYHTHGAVRMKTERSHNFHFKEKRSSSNNDNGYFQSGTYIMHLKYCDKMRSTKVKDKAT